LVEKNKTKESGSVEAPCKAAGCCQLADLTWPYC